MMKLYFISVRAEMIKLKRAPILFISFIAFAIAPVMAGIFIFLARHPEMIEKASGLKAKAHMFSVTSEWISLLSILSQAAGVGGILIFGFVISWIFGREYTDHTIKDILSIPVSRTMIMKAKFSTFMLWCLSLSLSNLLIGLIIGYAINLDAFEPIIFQRQLNVYMFTSLLAIAINTPVALIATITRGYLAPLGFVAITLVLSQIIAATGYGEFFPWAIPALYSMSSMEGMMQISAESYWIVIFTSVLGILLSGIFSNSAGHTK